MTRSISIDHEQSWQVTGALPVQYEIIETNVFDVTNTALLKYIGTGREGIRHPCLIIDELVDHLFGQRIRKYFHAYGTQCHTLTLLLSEEQKTVEMITSILTWLDSLNLSRRQEPLIGIGGGVLLDITGFAASIYRRGIPYVRIPTTLIGLVDAGVGVKTGIDFCGHKNRLGTYYPPLAVLLDFTFLETLDRRHLSNGLAEVIKMGIAVDGEIVTLLENYGGMFFEDSSGQEVRQVVRLAIQAMIDELEPNLWEKDLQRRVDFGHIFSPGIEMAALPSLLHGEAVAIDMALSTCVAYNRHMLTRVLRNRILDIIGSFRLPIYDAVCQPSILATALYQTKLHHDNHLHIPLPVSIGRVEFVDDISFEEICSAIKDVMTIGSTETGIRHHE